MGKPNKFDGMMHEYCVIKGWCGGVIDGEPLHVTNFIPNSGKVTAKQFVKWLLAAEGIDHNSSGYKKWMKDLVPIFHKHMGSYEVDVSLLKSGWSN